MRHFKCIREEIYKANIWFIKSDKNRFVKQLSKELGYPVREPTGCANFGVYEKNDVEINVIWISDWCYLSHEIFHCVHYILQERGITLTDSSEEAYAYFIEFLDKSFRKYEGR